MKVALIYGGRSVEHDVSICSARKVYRALIDGGHQVTLIAITLDGQWYLQQKIDSVIDTGVAVSVIPGRGLYAKERVLEVEAAFAPTHGMGGEDGNLQGLCTLADLPLAGCDTLSSSIGMNKAITQDLCRSAGIPTVDTIVVQCNTPLDEQLYHSVCQNLGAALCIKPERGGSSVGVTTLVRSDFPSFVEAVQFALRYSTQALIQPLIHPLVEIECAILETEDGSQVVGGPALVVNPGLQRVGFLDYHHKYGTTNTAYLDIENPLEAELKARVVDLALRTFTVIGASGYARIDFFLSGTTLYLNEINTAPGLTEASHWPAMMEKAGYPMPVALTHLLKLALARFARERALCTTPPELQ